MTEGGLLSSVMFKAMAADNFVCVRIFSTALGGGHAQVRQFLPGISDELRRHLMYQGNSLVILTPDGKVIDTQYRAVEQSDALKEVDVQMEEKIPEGLLRLREVMKRFPAKSSRFSTPWQFSPAHALVVAWDDNRRIVVAPSQEGKVDAGLERVLSEPDLLKKYHSRYVFVKAGAEHKPPAEIRDALAKVGPGGVLVLDVPTTDTGCFGSGKDAHYQGAWSRILASSPGPHSPTSLASLLQEHHQDLPTYVTQGCESTRKKGRPVRTGFEPFEVLWKSAPASVRQRWTREAADDMKSYSGEALARWGIK